MEKYESIKQRLKSTLSEKRFEHSLGVAETAAKLAERYGCDEDMAYLTGLVHDCAKRYKTSEQAAAAAEYGVELDEMSMECPAVIHAPLGAEIARREFGIDDEEMLNAIRRHTVGGKNMTALDKIIYLADMIEPSREYDVVDKIRKTAKSDLDEAVLLALDESVKFQIKKETIIHPATLYARNELIITKNRKKEK